MLGYAPDASETWLFFAMRSGSYNEDSLIEFLTELREELHSEQCTLIWDGLPSHKSKKMMAFLATQADWLVVERLRERVLAVEPVCPAADDDDLI